LTPSSSFAGGGDDDGIPDIEDLDLEDGDEVGD
jgi:hypothetical protein